MKLKEIRSSLSQASTLSLSSILFRLSLSRGYLDMPTSQNMISLHPLRPNFFLLWWRGGRGRGIVLEKQKSVYSKNRKHSYQIRRGWVFLLSSWCTGIGLLPSCGPPSLLRSCVVPLQAVLDSFCTGPSSKFPDDLGDVDKYQASVLQHD